MEERQKKSAEASENDLKGMNGLIDQMEVKMEERQHIYDIAGNVIEWTLEKNSNGSRPCAPRGGHYDNDGSDSPAANRYSSSTTRDAGGIIGFRLSLW